MRFVDPLGLAQLLIWPPRGQQVGHSALLLEDNTYISEWPLGDWVNPIGKPRSEDIRLDILDEKSLPLSTPINGLDEQAVKDWWKNNKESVFYRYNALFSNCADTVVDALEAGGGDVPYHFINTPTDLFFDYYSPNSTQAIISLPPRKLENR